MNVVETLFLEHCINGNLNDVKEIVNNNKNYNFFDSRGVTLACIHGHCKIVDYLLKNVKNYGYNDKYKLLSTVIIHDYLDIFKLLLHEKNFINNLDLYEFLNIAIVNSKLNIITYLIEEMKIDPRLNDVILIAIKNYNYKALELLLHYKKTLNYILNINLSFEQINIIKPIISKELDICEEDVTYLFNSF